jgi:hypothetical protein
MTTGNTPRPGAENEDLNRTVKLPARDVHAKSVADLNAYRVRTQHEAARRIASPKPATKLNPIAQKTAASQRPALAASRSGLHTSARLAILMEEEAIARMTARKRTKRWAIACATAFIALITVPLALSALSATKPAKGDKPAATRLAPVR